MATSTYSIVERGGCRIVTGEVPVSAFGMLLHGMGKDAVMDTDLARMLNAQFVIGSPEDIRQLKADPEVLARARAQVAVQAGGLSAAAVEWLATGERGMSSEAMFYQFTGVGEPSSRAPSDPADFRRCRLLLEQVPEFLTQLPEMAEVSPTWKALVAHWDELATLMDSEMPNWRDGSGRVPKTYALMKQIGC